MSTDQPDQPGPSGQEPPQDGHAAGEHQAPGPLGWLEMTVEIMRDRSHSSWMLLRDEELLRALRERGAVTAYLPGAEVALPDLVVLRLAVSPDGHVVVARPGRPPEAGEQHVHEWLPTLLDDLKTVAGVGPGENLGPPWLPVDETVHAAHAPTEDVRAVYCYRGTETMVAGAFARELGMPLSVHVEDGWVVSATPYAPDRVLTGPPGRLTGAFPFVILERRGRQRRFAYTESAKASALSVAAEWRPPLRPVSLDDPHPDTLELAHWLADPGAWERRARAVGELPAAPERELPPGMTAEQDAVIVRWMDEGEDAGGFLPETAAAFGMPTVAAQLVETRSGSPDPAGGRTVVPTTAADFVAGAMAEQDTEPEGRTPWTVVSRLLWRQPLLGLALGIGELLVAAVLVGVVVAGDRAWWWWVLVVAFALVGLFHVGEALLRLRWRRRGGAPGQGHGAVSSEGAGSDRAWSDGAGSDDARSDDAGSDDGTSTG